MGRVSLVLAAFGLSAEFKYEGSNLHVLVLDGHIDSEVVWLGDSLHNP